MKPLTNTSIVRKPAPVRGDQTQTPAGVQTGNGSSSRGTQRAPQPQVQAPPPDPRSQAGTTGGPTATQQDTKSPYLYKKEMDDAKKANAAERKEAKATADGLHKEMQSLGRDVSRLESKLKSEEGKKTPNGLKQAELRNHLDAKRNELGEKSGQYREVSRRLTHLEGQNVGIENELSNIRDMSKRTIQSPITKGEHWYKPQFQSPVTRSPESQAYQAEKKNMHGMSADNRAFFTEGKANPEIGTNLYRSHLGGPDHAAHSPTTGTPAARTPFTASDASFDAVVGAKGFIKPEHLPPKSETASPRQSATFGGGDEALPVYHYKQTLKEAQPEIKKQITAERGKQETLRGEVVSLGKAIGKKEQEISRAEAATQKPGSSRAGESLPGLRSELADLQGQLTLKKTEMSHSLTRLDELHEGSGAVSADLKNIRKETNLHLQSPVTIGESWRSPLHFQNPVASNPGREQYMQDKADFKAMSPAERMNHRTDISDRQDPQVGLNHHRDALESRVTGQPIPDRRTDEQKAKEKAASEKEWKELSPEKKASFTSARIVEQGGERFLERRVVPPQPGSTIIPTFDDMLRNPTNASRLDASMFRDTPESAATQRRAPQPPPTMHGALNPPPLGQGRMPTIDE